ncbi:MAG: hypothetical protein K0S45_2488 [Nitrospira sp.]|nr:hypothetical protein [Nitrospira sp.]
MPQATDNSQLLSRLRHAPRTIAVLRALQLGDLLCSVPALRALRQALPHSHIVLIGLPWAAGFVSRFSRYLDEHIEFPGFPGLPERPVAVEMVPRFLAAMQQRRFDMVLQMHGSGHYSNQVAVLLGGDKTAGFFQPPEFCPDDELFMPYPDDLPEVQRHLQLIRRLGLPVHDEELEFPVTEEDEAAFSGLSSVQALQPGSFICVHPGGRGQNRRWSPEQFAIVADRLACEGYEIVVTGTAEEESIVRTMANHMRFEPIVLAGQTNLGTMALLLRRARLLLANDTGVSHMAAALKVPSVICCIGSDPLRWSPSDHERHRVLAGSMITIESVCAEIQHVLNAGHCAPVMAMGRDPVPSLLGTPASLSTWHHQYLTGM